MNDYSLRQINMMQKLCDDLVARRTDPVKFVSNQWALIDLVRSDNPSFWSEYQSVVNEIETVVAIALDGKGNLGVNEWSEIEKIVRRMQKVLKEILVRH